MSGTSDVFNMLDDFLSFIRETDLFLHNDPILLAVSGGIDSVVMTELFHQAGFTFAIAHCNFQLRDKESDADELFVRDLASKYRVEFLVRKFDTTSYAADQGVSVQMAARDLRYAWFETLQEEHGFRYVATAHHLDDQIETFFINLFRGTGLAGLHGILPRQKKVIHPLMFCYRNQIEEFAHVHNLSWRIDSSNQSLKYTRNFIRHKILPEIESINPDYRQTITSTIDRLRQAESVYKDFFKEIEQKMVNYLPEKILISIPDLEKLAHREIILYEIIAPFGFNYPTTCTIIGSLEHKSLRKFLSSSHLITKEREYITIIPIKNKKDPEGISFSVGEDVKEINFPLNLSFSVFEYTPDFILPADPGIACLDYSLLSFPLKLRKWKMGDVFHPLGMKGKKKLSDFFIDNKFTFTEKEDTWLLISADSIAWIIGHRISDWFRITPSTTKIFRIEWKR
jgi:tRNA(Ile)-lysidine synthase